MRVPRLLPFARLALAGIHREYPNKIAHVLHSADDALPPHRLTPVFYGCFDWHSAVHAHWTLVRAWPTLDGSTRDAATAALDQSFTRERVDGELSYLAHPDRRAFELPYGMAWLVLLDAELTDSPAPRAATWQSALEPLAQLAHERLVDHFQKLRSPIRTGEHRQTAFALGLAIDAARATGRPQADALAARGRALFLADRDGPLHLEPSAFDFLSPCLAQVDTVGRVVSASELAQFIDRFLPRLGPQLEALAPAACRDPSDGHESHLIGLNLSRAWMLARIGNALPDGDARRPALFAAANDHARAGLAAVSDEHYAGAHWLGTFATYLLTHTAFAPD